MTIIKTNSASKDMDKIALNYEAKIIRNMLLYIYAESKKRKTKTIPLEDIEKRLFKHKNSVFSWCQWCCAASVLEGNGVGFGVRRNLANMTFKEFYDYIHSIHI